MQGVRLPRRGGSKVEDSSGQKPKDKNWLRIPSPWGSRKVPEPAEYYSVKGKVCRYRGPMLDVWTGNPQDQGSETRTGVFAFGKDMSNTQLSFLFGLWLFILSSKTAACITSLTIS